VSCAIYGSTLLCLYGVSTFYHSARSRPLKRILKVCDHSAIYLLIAGTYTPFLLVNLRGAWGWSLFSVIWGLAMAGILFKIVFAEHFPALSTAVYLLMGWLALVAIKPLLLRVPLSGLLWLLAGSDGFLFLVQQVRLDGQRKTKQYTGRFPSLHLESGRLPTSLLTYSFGEAENCHPSLQKLYPFFSVAWQLFRISGE
jgi:channel protein (hemolysin III family)